MRDLLNDAAGNNPQRCMALALARNYPGTALACGGCPACRAQRASAYAQRLRLSAELYHGSARSALLNRDLAALIEPGRPLTFEYDPPLTQADLINALVMLIERGVQQFILPENLDSMNWIELARRAVVQSRKPHRFVSMAEVVAHRSHALFGLPTVAIYPQDQSVADKLHLSLRQALATDIPRINIAPRSLYLPSENGKLIDHCEGLVRNLNALGRIGDTSNIVLF